MPGKPEELRLSELYFVFCFLLNFIVTEFRIYENINNRFTFDIMHGEPEELRLSGFSVSHTSFVRFGEIKRGSADLLGSQSIREGAPTKVRMRIERRENLRRVFIPVLSLGDDTADEHSS
jgi:hypothetical protein